MGDLVGSERMQTLAMQANRYAPELRTHDRFGNRIDAVEYHPAYHELMALAFGAGLHSLVWTDKREGVWVARAALNYLWNQGENGVACPVTMSFAAVRILRHDAKLAEQWEPKLLACDYDPRPLPLAQKRAVTIGMAMTERQGGSDLRANSSQAVPMGEGEFELAGHKWFCSAPMSDAFFTLARTGAGLTCFFVPRSLADGTRNPFFIQRLKDKCGNRSNASSEIEYCGTRARIVGEEGRGIATLIEMAHLTRFDIVVACAGMMRAALNQALHHAVHRQAFGRRLVEQPLMQNVLADLALETEAAALLVFRLSRAFDRAEGSRKAKHQQRRGFGLESKVGQHVLHQRLLDKPSPESLAVHGVVKRLIQRGAHHSRAGDDDIEAREVRHLDQRGDAAPFLSDDPRAGAAILDFRGGVGAVSALVLQTLDEKRVARAVGKRTRHEKAGQPRLGTCKGEKGVAHRGRAEPLVPGELEFAFAHRHRPRRVGAKVRAALPLGHRHADRA